MMTADPRIVPFREASREMAEALNLPVLTPTGSFVADASVAWLAEHVEAWHEQTQIPRFDPGWFHASSLGRSDAELIAQYRGEGSDAHDATTLRIFDLGHNRDRAWKGYLRDAQLSVCADDSDRKIRIDNIRLSGECDDIVRHPETGELCVFEFKTCNAFKFGQLVEPMRDHVLQTHAYMAGLALRDTIIVYECKDNQRLRVFPVRFSVETWCEITTRLRRLRLEAEVGMPKAAALEV